jgi:hypothetical protein
MIAQAFDVSILLPACGQSARIGEGIASMNGSHPLTIQDPDGAQEAMFLRLNLSSGTFRRDSMNSPLTFPLLNLTPTQR